jgi:ribonuclease P protein component
VADPPNPLGDPLRTARPRLTPLSREPYHPPDDERACALTGARRVCVPLGGGERRPEDELERIAQSPDEANVPAQEAPSRQGARIPRTHADDERPARDRRSAGTRSEATDGLTDGRGSNSPRLVMLSRPQDFAAVQGSGTSRSNPLLTARFIRTDLETTRFGLSTGRKLGGAVVRNRVRRRLREALRVMAPSFQPGWDVLIIARPAIVEADHATLVGSLRRLLHRGGVFGGPAAT